MYVHVITNERRVLLCVTESAAAELGSLRGAHAQWTARQIPAQLPPVLAMF